MQGYDAEKALAYIQRNVNRKSFSELGPSIDGYLRQAQELDLLFMRDMGVLDDAGYMGDADYDEDEAFEYIVEEITRIRGLSDEAAILVASVVDAYMGAQDAFLKQEGLRETY